MDITIFKQGKYMKGSIYKWLKAHTALNFIFGGILLIMIAALWETYSEEQCRITKTTINLISHLGIGGIVIGVLGILFDTRHWIDYFKERLKEIVIEKEYLDKYSLDELTSLQKDVLKAYFKDQNIGGTEGFLNYYQEHIQAIIGNPFRMNVIADFHIKYLDKSKDKLVVDEVIIFQCKSNRGKIQKEIKYIPEKNEFEKVEIISVKLEHETFEFPKGGKEILIEFASFDEAWLQPEGLGFIMPMKEYEDWDGLKITLTLRFIISTQRFISWKMAYITKGLSITINYPDDINIEKMFYCMQNNIKELPGNYDGHCRWGSDGWILPNEGIAFQFIPKS